MADELDRIVDRLMPQLLPDFRSFARRLIETGMQAERDRVIALIQAPSAAASESRSSSPHSYPAAHGSISRPVLEAMQELATTIAGGIGAADLALFFKNRGGGPNDRQVRAAIKQLTNTGDAIRVSRGRYLPRAAATPLASGENPDADTSGH